MQEGRYIRQTILKEFGEENQKKLSESSVLVVGAGGLGVPVLQYLNAMGIGSIGLIDNDTVTISNLHRQVLYSENDLEQSKISVALSKLQAQNSTTHLKAYHVFLDSTNAFDIIQDYDLVVDCSDNFPTRYLINDACIILGKPFIYGALHGFEGHVSVFNYNEGPTYRCLFPTMPIADEIPNCNEQGVLGVIPGIIGNLQALEAVKVLTGIGKVLAGKLLIFNALEQTYHKFNILTVEENKLKTKLENNYQLTCDIKVHSISTDKITNLIQNDKSIQIIDVRSLIEFENYHIDKSINIPLDSLIQEYKTINFSKATYFICQSGVRSLKAIQLLKTYLPEVELVHIEGGINQLKHYVARH